MDYVLMVDVTLSGKTAYVKDNFDHEVIRLSYFENSRKKRIMERF